MRKSSIVCVSFLSLLLVGTGDADAKDRTKTRKSKSRKVSVVGEYDGIRPGSVSFLPPGARHRGKKKPNIYWVGFQAQESGSSRVFIQLGTEVEVQQWIEGTQLVVLLEGARIANRTVQRYLDTRYFDTSVQTFRTRQVRKRKAKGDVRGHDKGVELRFSFKNPVDAIEANATVASEQDGYSYVYLDFGRETDSL
ncbi:MAG: hypothetical protein JKY56_23630 [Kofleriaceae bacterium]|nr:hypothetical protein [Kofleriaceae bacterium]